LVLQKNMPFFPKYKDLRAVPIANPDELYTINGQTATAFKFLFGDGTQFIEEEESKGKVKKLLVKKKLLLP